uniref:Uncharacterized protein n=1 Tax=Polysiphonia infestans TaxID=2006978 RepID=A0A1Z1MEE8_9FLOR|nr:hypothetical protein [Polysiphonia infestans]ARW64279.1 hypothetical protein [Polysiphonia infestans]
MIRYWPTQQSIYLNNSIVDLFIETEKKIFLVKNNKSNKYLYLDILSKISRNKLFKYVIKDFKKLVLDLIELDLDLKKISQISNKIRNVFIERISKKFLCQLRYKDIKWQNKKKSKSKYNDLIEYLLMYLIFGSSSINQNTFVFLTTYTPYNHVKILLENFIIQMANNIIEEIIDNLNYSSDINIFLKNHNICNKLYSSNRSIVLFLNNIKWQNFLQLYIYETKYFYSERQQICLLSSQGIITKYIHISNITVIKSLNKFKTVFLFWLEVKDFTIPKIEKLLIVVAKYFLYSSLNLLSNLFLIIIKIIVIYLSKKIYN